MKDIQKIVIVDPNYLVRLGLKSVLENEPMFKIQAEFSNFNDCINAVNILNPDLLILGFTVHSVSGPDVVKQVKKKRNDQKILVVDTKEDLNDIIVTLRMGVQGYILRQCDRDEILEASRQVLNGKTFFCSNVVKINKSQKDSIELSERELQVLSQIAEGLTNNEIGEKIFLSPHTVATHRKNLMKKFKAANNVDLIIRAIKHHILVP